MPAGADLTFRTWYDIETGLRLGLRRRLRRRRRHVGQPRGLHRHRHRPLGGHPHRRPRGLRGQEHPHPLRVPHRRRRGAPRLGSHRHQGRRQRSRAPARSTRTAGCASTASTSESTERYYIAEYRTYDGFDASLKNAYQWNDDYDELGRLVQLQPRPAPDLPRHVLRRQRRRQRTVTAVSAAGWSSTHDRPRTAWTTTTAPPIHAATGGRASRCATRPFSVKPTQDAERSTSWTTTWAGRIGESTAPGQARPAVVQGQPQLLVRRRRPRPG